MGAWCGKLWLWHQAQQNEKSAKMERSDQNMKEIKTDISKGQTRKESSLCWIH